MTASAFIIIMGLKKRENPAGNLTAMEGQTAYTPQDQKMCLVIKSESDSKIIDTTASTHTKNKVF